MMGSDFATGLGMALGTGRRMNDLKQQIADLMQELGNEKKVVLAMKDEKGRLVQQLERSGKESEAMKMRLEEKLQKAQALEREVQVPHKPTRTCTYTHKCTHTRILGPKAFKRNPSHADSRHLDVNAPQAAARCLLCTCFCNKRGTRLCLRRHKVFGIAMRPPAHVAYVGGSTCVQNFPKDLLSGGQDTGRSFGSRYCNIPYLRSEPTAGMADETWYV